MHKDIHHAAPIPQVMATVYFGSLCANMDPAFPEISDVSFQRFIDESITPRFPGFTITKAQGYWKGKPEMVRVFTIVADDDTSFRTNIRMMAERYKSDFGQEAVAYAFTACEFTLNCWPYGPVGAYHRAGKGY